jgi:hypothetical protein
MYKWPFAWLISLRGSLLRSDSQAQFHSGANFIEKLKLLRKFYEPALKIIQKMKQAFFAVVWVALMGCKDHSREMPQLGALSFAPEQVWVGGVFEGNCPDSSVLSEDSVSISVNPELQRLTFQLDTLSGKAGSWQTFLNDWHRFDSIWVNSGGIVASNPGFVLSPEEKENTRRWITLNERLLRLTGKVCFADALEHALYNKLVSSWIPRNLIDSAFYMHDYDKVYVNLFGESSLEFWHTTGGKVRIVQETQYPEHGEVRVRFELEDTRLIDLFVRIPEWAPQAFVSLGNVKYVANPGEYCQVSHKWKSGDELKVVLLFPN